MTGRWEGDERTGVPARSAGGGVDAGKVLEGQGCQLNFHIVWPSPTCKLGCSHASFSSASRTR